MNQRQRLSEYRKKRSFDQTPEPRGGGKGRRKAARALIYAIQKHMASHLHYDLRLGWDGVLLSWAIPKGPSTDPTVKRLATQTEDHPVEYADFEGIIPAGEYGGGTVMLWDEGSWVPDDPDVSESLQKGEIKFTLEGEKLRGSWVLVHTRGMRGDSRQRSWLLIKHRDAYASPSDVTEKEPRSVKTHRLLREIAEEEGGDVARASEGDPAARTRADGKQKTPRPARRSSPVKKLAGPQVKRQVKQASTQGKSSGKRSSGRRSERTDSISR
jgi:bifunctional non-homologous end joining protein LigD